MSQAEVSHSASVMAAHANNQASAVPSALTREARAYAIKELARRAGVTKEFFSTWRMEFSENGTTIFVLPGTRKRVFFRNAPEEIWEDLIANKSHTVRLGWLNESAVPSIQNAVIPFIHRSQAQSRALFQTVDSESIECAVDLPLSSLLILSRWEERLVREKDTHDRVPATASIAYREGFLRRPIVDEYGLAFRQVLEALIPNWKPSSFGLRVNVSHDVDNIGLPFNLRSAVGHTIRRKKPEATVKDFLAILPGINPTLLEAIRELVTLSLRRGLKPAVYWKGISRGSRQRDYDPYNPKVRAMIAWLQQHEVEMGAHPGYDTFRSPDKLRREVQMIREILGGQPIGGRQDYLRWCPDSWLDWENCGLVYDSTVGFADHIGFRAGTSFPYYPWFFTLNRQARVLELPLIVMDCTLTSYMRLGFEKSLIAISECVEQCRKVGGVFTLLWHNDSMMNPTLEQLFVHVLDSLSGHHRYDYANPPKDLY